MKLITKGLMFTGNSELEGFAELYREEWTDVHGKKHVDHELGEIYTDLKDKPKRVEYPVSTHMHLGTVKVKLERL